MFCYIVFIVGGDVFIYVKCNIFSKLFELVQVVMKNMFVNSVEFFEDVYSFVYKNGRDFFGFIDGTVFFVRQFSCGIKYKCLQ